MVEITADDNATTEYEVPVSWKVSSVVRVRAKSLKEALGYVKEFKDSIPVDADAEYVSGSYQVDVDNVEDCLQYQGYCSDDPVICMKWSCADNISQYTDSMLFNEGEIIAEATFAEAGTLDKDDLVTYQLRVAGDVKVKFDGNIYKNYDQFPNELKQLIKDNPNEWENIERVEVIDRNWFEYYSKEDSDANFVFEEDVPTAFTNDPQKVLNDMAEMAAQYYGLK